MTDEEIICTWMEQGRDNTKWRGRGWHANLTLDALWEVEERLVQMHKVRWVEVELLEMEVVWLFHATPAQKIAALAAVLRPLVEPIQPAGPK